MRSVLFNRNPPHRIWHIAAIDPITFATALEGATAPTAIESRVDTTFVRMIKPVKHAGPRQLCIWETSTQTPPTPYFSTDSDVSDTRRSMARIHPSN